VQRQRNAVVNDQSVAPSFGNFASAERTEVWVLNPTVAPQPRLKSTAFIFPEGDGTFSDT
jgi:hypothetical protein